MAVVDLIVVPMLVAVLYVCRCTVFHTHSRCRGETGELGRRRIGTCKYLEDWQLRIATSAFMFSFFVSGNVGNYRLPFSGAQERCILGEWQKTIFIECYFKLCVPFNTTYLSFQLCNQ